MQDLIIGCIPLGIALLVSIRYFKRLEPKWLRLFPLFIIVTLLFEFGGFYYSAIFKKSNHFIFNIYICIEYSFYIYIFYLAALKKPIKKIFLILGIAFAIFYFVDIFVFENFFIYSTRAGNAGEFITLVCCIIFLSQLLMGDELINFFTTPMFWITTGIMIATVGDFLYLAFFDYIMKNKLDPNGTVYGIIAVSLGIVEYGFFSIGFICKEIWKKTR